MNQFLRPAPLKPDTATCSTTHAPRAAVVAVEYDDGVPATVASGSSRPAPEDFSQSVPAGAPATPLAAVPRECAIDYDDGDPATIVC